MTTFRSPSDDPRSTEELFDAAIYAASEDDCWKAIRALQSRGGRESFERAKELCNRADPRMRTLGVDILCQLGSPNPFVAQCTGILLYLLKSESDPGVLNSIGVGLGHLNAAEGIKPLSKLKNHPDSDVRFGVVLGLSGHENDLAIATLIDLSRDEDDDVRDWATFALGSQLELDRADIRDALADRLNDKDDETRGEAFAGLAARHDSRVMAPLVAELSSDSVGILALEAATSLGAPELYELLLEVKEWIGENEEQDKYFNGVLDEAIEACKPRSDSAKRTRQQR